MLGSSAYIDFSATLQQSSQFNIEHLPHTPPLASFYYYTLANTYSSANMVKIIVAGGAGSLSPPTLETRPCFLTNSPQTLPER
jgi:hypothetical protein